MKIGELGAHLATPEMLRISEKVWPETYQNFKWLSQIEGTSLKFKNLKWFLFRSRYMYLSRTKNNLKNVMPQSLFEG
jgi:hypothetical protein